MQSITQETERGALLAEGKTKCIFEAVGNPEKVIIDNKSKITALDDPDRTREFTTKAISATKTTCNVFQLLKDAGLPVAFDRQLSDTAFLAPKCTMIPLEVVARRFAPKESSYAKRRPDLILNGSMPYRFNRLEIEFFLKTTSGGLTVNGKSLVEGLDAKAGEEDPHIQNVYGSEWRLFHPKKPTWDPSADLKRTIDAAGIGLILREEGVTVADLERLTRLCFLVLERAWALLGYRLIDFKIEFGIGWDGMLYIADVIDNDSWRLRTFDWTELSKQLFRDGVDLAKVEKAYSIVAALTDRFRIPKQALVLWRGSDKDEVADIPAPRDLAAVGVELVCVCKSAHKSTQSALQQLTALQSAHPNGGVIVAAVGRSNGLGPVLATHTDWPIVALCLSQKEFPDDVWSSLRMPSNVPLATVWPAANAFQFALRILGQSNPAVYAQQRYALEQLDQ